MSIEITKMEIQISVFFLNHETHPRLFLAMIIFVDIYNYLSSTYNLAPKAFKDKNNKIKIIANSFISFAYFKSRQSHL